MASEFCAVCGCLVTAHNFERVGNTMYCSYKCRLAAASGQR